jgi:uncharacterized protein involved in outer membrane biogenesis
VAALVVVAAYAALGWWGVPALVRWQLPAQAQSLLQREASVGEVRFDPFRLRLQAQDLQLRDADGDALLALDTLVADLRWSSLVRRTWSFDELRLQGPVLRLVVDPQGRLNLAQLLAALPTDPQPRPEPAPLPRLQVADLQLQAGRIDWDDRRAGVRDSLGAIELRMQDFSTLPETTDAWTLNARLGSGATLRWRGEASWQPLRGSGELALDGLALPVAAPYLRQATRVALADGRLSARLPYRFALVDGRLELALAGASLDLRQLALAPAARGAPFLQLAALQLEGLDADLLGRRAQAASLRLQGLQAAARRGADGTLDLAALFTPPAGARPATAPQAPAAGAAPVPAPGWSFALQQLQLDDARLRLHDAQAVPPVDLALEGLGLQARIEAQAEAGAGTPAVRISQAQLQARRLALQPEGGAPQVLEQLALKDGALDLAARRAQVGSVAVGGGQLRIARDAQGGLGLPAWPAPAAGTAPAPAPAAAGAPWQAQLAQLKVGPLEVDVADAATGIATRLQGLTLQLADAGTDPAKPLRFEAGLQVREGGQLAARGTVLPGAGTLEAQLQLRRLALPIAQPLLAQHLRLKLASGTASADGRLQARWSGPRPQLRYTGRAEVADLRLNEVDGDLFARWRSVAADRLAVGTDGVDIPELRVVGAEASLIIEPDRSFNAARLLVRQPPKSATGPAATAAAPAAQEPPRAPAAAPAPAADPFPVRIQRVRLQDAQLEFEDLSLRPPFGARIEGLSGVVTGLASRIDARSQLELDGRVGEFGLARIRGALNPFALRDSTDLSVVFRNVDMVPASPYAMKFAGYRIAEGRISLDLRYRVRDGKLDGDNRIVLERLTLGERVDSPDALKLPLELALAILKDGDGRIDLGLPVTGDLDDPQFSYGAVIWKAVVNVLTRVVTAPFRALGSLLGAGSEKLEAIEFDPGSDRLQPPEREKLVQLAQALAKKPQLRLGVPGAWHEALDAAALRQRAVRTEVVRRAGLKLEEGESPGPLDVADPAIRAAVRALYTQRFGEAGWQEAKRAAEAAPAAPAAAGTASAPAPARSEVPVWRRVGNFVQGEPQVADAVGFYRRLARQLEAAQPLPPEALAALAQRRAQAVAAALRQAGVDEARVALAPAAAVAEAQKVVPLRLELATR